MIERISVSKTAQMLAQEEVVIVDIRDEKSFQQGHIKDAIHLNNSNVQNFLSKTDQTKPIIVCCYHGNASQSAAEYFNQQGFEQSCSMDGGMSEWALTQEVIVED